jgi:hypothetical protein
MKLSKSALQNYEYIPETCRGQREWMRRLLKMSFKSNPAQGLEKHR